jgi:hypothetical protein
MIDLEELDGYEVEHNNNYEMTSEQLRKLIWQKFERNNVLQHLVDRQEVLTGAD